MVPREQFFWHLQMASERYWAVESVPEWPHRPGVYYSHATLPQGDGRHLMPGSGNLAG